MYKHELYLYLSWNYLNIQKISWGGLQKFELVDLKQKWR